MWPLNKLFNGLNACSQGEFPVVHALRYQQSISLYLLDEGNASKMVCDGLSLRNGHLIYSLLKQQCKPLGQAAFESKGDLR